MNIPPIDNIPNSQTAAPQNQKKNLSDVAREIQQDNDQNNDYIIDRDWEPLVIYDQGEEDDLVYPDDWDSYGDDLR